jgi:hypothetical protein
LYAAAITGALQQQACIMLGQLVGMCQLLLLLLLLLVAG